MRLLPSRDQRSASRRAPSKMPWLGRTNFSPPALATPLPDAPDVRDRDIARINRESFSPQASGLLTDVIPIDMFRMENALQQFLDQLDDLGQDVGGWLRTAGPMPWVVLSLGIAAATAEIARRRCAGPRQSGRRGNCPRDALQWVPPFINQKEESSVRKLSIICSRACAAATRRLRSAYFSSMNRTCA